MADNPKDQVTIQSSSQMIGTVLSGRYRLEAKLGSGGMSTVFLARDDTLDRAVAVKVMHREMSEQPDQLKRFNQEARSVAKLSHQNVVSVIDAGEDGGHPYIVFEFVEGETLKQRIQRLGRLPVQEAVAYAIEIGRGVSVAHSANMVHRDIKPQNVLIDSEGRAKVTDFGIARQMEQQGVTATGRVLGTTDYVAPEQAMGQGADPRSDIYSLGVVLYEMLIGDVPFHADSQVGVAMKHVNEELPDVQRRRPEVSAAVALAVERATTKDPNTRYQSMQEMLDDLQTALEVEAARAGQSTGEATTVLDAVSPDKRTLSRRTKMSWAAIGLLALAGAAAIVLVILISSGDVGDGKGKNDGGEKSPAAAGGALIDPTAATAFDPEGDGAEHSEEVKLAIDGNPTSTAWSTESYQDPIFTGAVTSAGVQKKGVGIYVDAGDTVVANSIVVQSLKGGADLQIYAAASGPPDALDGWTLVGDAQDVESKQTISLDTANNEFRYYLIWATKLADYSGAGRLEVSDVKLYD